MAHPGSSRPCDEAETADPEEAGVLVEELEDIEGVDLDDGGEGVSRAAGEVDGVC